MKPTALRAPSQPAPHVPLRTPILAGLGLALALVFATSFGGACDSTATISWKSTKLERIQMVSAAPLATPAGGGGLERQCSIGPDDVIGGVEFGFVVKSTDPDERCAGAPDEDWGVRPGDELERRSVEPGVNMTAGAFELLVDCVEPYPDPDILTTRECQGVSGPDFNLEQVDYRAFYEEPGDAGDLPVRCEPVSVVLLIDQSGSMKGFVDPLAEYREQPAGFEFPSDDERRLVATDLNDTRLSAAQDFIGRLNANDKLLVMTFNESEGDDDLKVLCTLEPRSEAEMPGEPEYVRQAVECFGINRDIVLNAFEDALGNVRGRTPLWDAVRAAYDFLNRPDVEAPEIRHIVVVSDGPDTCNDGSVEGLQAGADDNQCGDASYEDVFNQITQGNAEPGGVPVHVHFIQLQAKGYPSRDGRMMELACATEGHYQFINTSNFPKVAEGGQTDSRLSAAITEALSRVRFSLLGYWIARAKTAAFDVAPTSAAYVAPGTIHGVSGTFSLLPGELTGLKKIQPFDATGEDEYGPWDLRVAFRRMCAEHTDCTTGAIDPCLVYCAAQEGICLDPPAALPDGTACTAAGVENGECCAGACQAGACN